MDTLKKDNIRVSFQKNYKIMSEIVIKVEKLSKLYRIGELHKQGNSFREKITTTFNKLLSPGNLKESGEKKSNGFIWALQDVSFEVQRGEVLGIIGRNGAGKSTLLKILSRITKPSKGRISIDGRVGSLLEVGTGFHQELTGRENIYLNGAIIGMRKAEIRRKLNQIMDFAEIDEFIDTPVKRYSSGMYVRLAFAVAAYFEPEILLIDEVLAVGDAAFQKKCVERVRAIRNEGKTVIMVSHNLNLIHQLCPRSILLDEGAIVLDSNTQRILDLYTERITPSKPDKDLYSELLRSSDSKKESHFKWTHVKLLNFKEQLTAEIRFGEAFKIILRAQVRKGCEDVRLGFGVVGSHTGVVFNSHHHFNGPLESLTEGIYEFHIDINPNILAPGFYRVNIGAVGTHVTDRILDCIGFRILDFGTEPEKIWNSSYKRGVIDYPWCAWRHEKI